MIIVLATHKNFQLPDHVTEYVKGCWDIWQRDQTNLQESCIDDSLKERKKHFFVFFVGVRSKAELHEYADP